ncbi:hypothetical protein VYU27_010581, partial [Nannochloropsis oceanica]
LPPSLPPSLPQSLHSSTSSSSLIPPGGGGGGGGGGGSEGGGGGIWLPGSESASETLRKSQEVRTKNLEKVPPQVVKALDHRLTLVPSWDMRITKEKLEQLGGVIMVDSSPVLSSGERSENVPNYAPKNFHITCQYCLKPFNGKNALRNFELHAIFWELYLAHPALLLPSTEADAD